MLRGWLDFSHFSDLRVICWVFATFRIDCSCRIVATFPIELWKFRILAVRLYRDCAAVPASSFFSSRKHQNER